MPGGALRGVVTRAGAVVGLSTDAKRAVNSANVFRSASICGMDGWGAGVAAVAFTRAEIGRGPDVDPGGGACGVVDAAGAAVRSATGKYVPRRSMTICCF